MNNLVMQIPLKPLSINKKNTISGKRRMIIKSMDARIYEEKINIELDKYYEQMTFFKNNITDKEALSFSIVVYIPKGDFFTKKGTINTKCLDVSNAIKMLEDIIYKRLGLNDGLNCKVTSEKRPHSGEEYLTLVNIEKSLIPKVCYLDEIVSRFKKLI